MVKKATKKATKKTILMLSPETHLKIKCFAAACKLTMGQFLTKLVDKFEDKTYSTEEYLYFLKFLELQAKEAEEEALTVVDKLEIQEAN